MTFYVNPSVKMEIDNTSSQERRVKPEKIFDEFSFISFNKSIFPKWKFPTNFLTDEEKGILTSLVRNNPSLVKDEKILADATFYKNIDVLLTTDRTHLADKNIRSRARCSNVL